jgi:hypothetical protein
MLNDMYNVVCANADFRRVLDRSQRVRKERAGPFSFQLFTCPGLSDVTVLSTVARYRASKRTIQHSSPSNERLLPKELKHLLPHPIRKLVLHTRHNHDHLPSSPPDVQRFYECTRRLPWYELIVRTREHENPLPRKGSGGRRNGIICAYQCA